MSEMSEAVGRNLKVEAPAFYGVGMVVGEVHLFGERDLNRVGSRGGRLSRPSKRRWYHRRLVGSLRLRGTWAQGGDEG